MNTPLSPSQAKRIAYKFFELYYNVITSNEYEKVLDYYVPDATFSRYGLNTSNSTEFKGLDVCPMFYFFFICLVLLIST